MFHAIWRNLPLNNAMTKREDSQVSSIPCDWDDAARLRRFRAAVARWYGRHARDLPWRQDPTTYSIWISEIMLQQTQVETVKPYFQRFLARFPDVASLAKAQEEQVLRLWEGLGYYRRARQLHAAARVIVDELDGQFPEQADAVLALPGIGRYTMGAILSIALDQRLPILEANTIRLFSRLVGFEGDASSRDGQAKLWGLAEQVLPKKNIGRFNQGLMEIGSLVCHVRDPNCGQCPVRGECWSFANGRQESIPPTKRKNYEQVNEVAMMVRRRDRVLLRQHTDEERWSGLWDFPRIQLPRRFGQENRRSRMAKRLAAAIAAETGIQVSSPRWVTRIKDGVTRYRITLDCFEAEAARGRLKRTNAPLKWVELDKLEEFPTNTTGRKIARMCQRSSVQEGN